VSGQFDLRESYFLILMLQYHAILDKKTRGSLVEIDALVEFGMAAAVRRRNFIVCVSVVVL